MGKITVFVEGAGEALTRPRLTDPVYDGTGLTPLYAVMCEAFPREPIWCPALPPATHAPRGWASSHLSPPLSRTRGAHHRGEVPWQERLVSSLLLLVLTIRGDPERVLEITPIHLYGAAPEPRPPLPAPAARDGVHAFLRTQEVTAVTGVRLVRLHSASPDDPRWAALLTRLAPQCRWMTTGPCPHGPNTTAAPPSPPPPPPRAELHGTAHGTPLKH